MTWLRELWDEAVGARREAVLDALPEDILDRVESGEPIGAGDLSFLGDMALEAGTSDTVAAVALRTIAILAEEGVVERDAVCEILREGLLSPSARRRYHVVSAIWQAELTEMLDVTRGVASSDESEHVRRLAVHVLEVLTAERV